jgi:hypothetical protein
MLSMTDPFGNHVFHLCLKLFDERQPRWDSIPVHFAVGLPPAPLTDLLTVSSS